jgi:hypothetical protein
MRVRVVLLAILLAVLAAPGASAQTPFGSLDVSSKGLIDDNGFVTIGTIVDCDLDAGLFPLLEGTLVQRRGQQTSETTVFQRLPGFCAGEPRPLPIAFTAGGFKPGPAVVSVTACSAGGCATFEERITLHRAGENVVLAAGDPPPLSVLEFEVASTGMIDTQGFITVGTVLSCLGVGTASVSADLVQQTGQRTATATGTRTELGVCFGGPTPIAVGLAPSPGSAPFKPGKARIELRACAGGSGFSECRTIETTIKLRKAD